MDIIEFNCSSNLNSFDFHFDKVNPNAQNNLFAVGKANPSIIFNGKKTLNYLSLKNAEKTNKLHRSR